MGFALGFQLDRKAGKNQICRSLGWWFQLSFRPRQTGAHQHMTFQTKITKHTIACMAASQHYL